ncbi:Vlp protein, delta subfamily (plasmid) [Borrelia crocidurae str. Achema]|uniref:Variable large protein n=1 Tax=Borrelia crocidurae (strain Achema) TaxID=1155096 RepID=I0FEW1_BORCA|nr:Vlp protein, delta subfamily [Borrelia crocidurae str. Achema]
MGGVSGEVKDPEKVFLSEMVNLGKGFLDVFVSFGDMVAGAFGIKAETKKSDVGKYFTDIATTMESVKNKLQTEVAKNGNYEKVKTVVDEFITGILDKIAAEAKEAAKGATGDDKIGGATQDGQDANDADKVAVNSLVKGIKEIVGVVLKDNEGNAEATKTGDTEKKSIGKLLGEKTNGGTEQQAAASATIGAVSGADILKAISVSGETSGEPTIQAAKNAAEIASAKKEDNKDLGDSVKKDSIIAAGIALRAMSKGGKFAAKAEEKAANAVNGAVASAVNKVLSTLVIAIRDRVDEGLKEINKVLGEIKQGEAFEAKVSE